MSIYRELAYDNPVSPVRGLQFGLLGPDEVRRRSVVEVTNNETYSGAEPVQNGLFDPRMGVVDNTGVCRTCDQRNVFCPGHFGHISLAKPVFYVQYMEIVRRLLRCVCFHCSKVLVDLESPEAAAVLARRLPRQKRWELMSKLCAKVRRCGQETLDGCGAKQPEKIVRTEDLKFKMVWRDLAGATPAAAALAARRRRDEAAAAAAGGDEEGGEADEAGEAGEAGEKKEARGNIYVYGVLGQPACAGHADGPE